MELQTIIVAVIILTFTIYLIKKFTRLVKGKDVCGGCGGCGGSCQNSGKLMKNEKWLKDAGNCLGDFACQKEETRKPTPGGAVSNMVFMSGTLKKIHQALGRYIEGCDSCRHQSEISPVDIFADKKVLADVLDRIGHKDQDEPLFMLETFLSAEGHLKAINFKNLLAAKGRVIGLERATQILDFFTSLGFAEKHFAGDGQILYERKGPGSHHDHIICTNCGLNQEFHRPDVDCLIEKIAGESGFSHLEHKLFIEGLCPQCRQSRNQSLSLNKAKVGETVSVVQINGLPETARRLNELGIYKNVSLKILGEQSGAMIVIAGESRLVVGPELAEHIMVKEILPRPRLL
ncbi:MAG: transcriptional repressor [Candidatus Adiutrix sp.]